jgi:DNA-binding transcriptional LysR family regulator
MEASSNHLGTRVFGRDQSVRGLLRVTLAPPLATHLLMPDFADFARLHPEIEMEILSFEEPVNLTNDGLTSRSASCTTATPCRSIFTA